MQILNLLVYLLFAGESSHLFVDALDVQLAAQVSYLLVPKFDHVEDPFVKILGLVRDECFEVLTGLLVLWEHPCKHFRIKLQYKEVLHFFLVDFLGELGILSVYMTHCFVHFLVQILQNLCCVRWNLLERLVSLLHVKLHICNHLSKLINPADGRLELGLH